MLKQPLCVDLDNTLIKTDIMFEASIKLLQKNPIKFIIFLYKFFISKSDGKFYLSNNIEIDSKFIPLNEEVLNFCKQRYNAGHEVFIATGAPEKYALSICEQFNFVKNVYSSNEKTNLVSTNKRKLLTSLFGEKGYDYIGDSTKDIPIWNSAKHCYLVGNNTLLSKKIFFEKVFTVEKNKLSDILKSLRPKQWVKNLLVFLPLLLAHQIQNTQKFQLAIQAFLSFCMIASAIYTMNDLTDIDNDRKHNLKKNRPLAACLISIDRSIILFLICAISGFLLGWNLGFSSFLILALYATLNIGYSFSWKKIIILDVVLLTSFYLLRISIGGIATDITISPWMRAFSFFLFISLAFLKRYSEVKKVSTSEVAGRGYYASDAIALFSFGSTCALLTVLVFSQYIFQSQISNLYKSPDWLWAAAIILLYWLSLLWLRAFRNEVHDDPVMFVLKDKASLILGSIFLVLTYLAI